MSNSHGRQRPGFPPANPPAHDGRQTDPRQPPRQPYAHGDEPSLSWPPRDVQPDPRNGGGHDGHGGHQNGREWPQPQQGYALPQDGNGQARYQEAHGRPLTAHPQAPYPADPYRYPNEPEGVAEDPYAQPTLGSGNRRGYAGAPPPHESGASPYSARFEAYVPPSVASEPINGRQDFGAGYGAAQEEPNLRSSSYEDGWPSTVPSQGGYARGEAAHYAPEQGYPQDQRYAQEQRYAQQPPAYGGEQWGEPAGGYAGGAQHQDHATGWPQGHGGDAYAYPTDQYGQPVDPALAAGPQNVAVNEEYDEYDEQYESEDAPPSGRSRLLMIVGALVGAIVIGAGLAYGYKTLSGGESRVAGVPPVVRGDAQSSKARPDDPGGRQFDHTDSQVMRRISQDGRASAATDASGTRRVSTMMISRDGRVVEPEQPSLPASAAPEQPVVSVPGLTVVDGFAGQRAARQAAAVNSGDGGRPIVVSPPNTAANALSPVRPVSVTQDPPKAAVVVSPPPKAPEKTAAVVAAVAPPRTSVPVAKTQPKPPVSAAPSPAPSTGGNGYVAVLASVPVSSTSRLDALKTFADIQQNYGNVLRDRTPDVREADLGAKGAYHRLMVGPPASRESANALCKELKSAGYPSCWITSY
ncbi:MAG: SPOR domain-containing protein [Alphaproteobacteria bacterium]|nr:SPOR domain-containing protein [Alphaproteobacteria bacterium]